MRNVVDWLYIGLILLGLFGCNQESIEFLLEEPDDAAGWDAAPDIDADTDTDSDADSDTDADTDIDPDTDSQTDSQTDTVPPCVQIERVEFDWEEAVLEGPMKSAASVFEDMTYIFTAVANQGTATRSFDLACADNWYFWAQAWVPVTLLGSPLNTFYIGLDGGPMAKWTLTEPDGFTSGWNWEVFRDGSAVAVPISGGTHDIVIKGGLSNGPTQEQHPALGKIIITNDPLFRP